MPVVTLDEWNRFTSLHPQAHLLQCGEWGALKAGFGWQPERIVMGAAGAQVLFKPLPLGFSLAYLPKGPLGADWDALWPEVDALCRRRRAVFLKVEPDAWQEDAGVGAGMQMAGFRPSQHDLQPPRTIVVDLQGDEEDLLARMKQKTRYNIRLAERKGVEVETSAHVSIFSELMEVTGERDSFGVHTLDYYRRAYELFYPAGMCELFIASYQGQALSGLMVFAQGKRAWYFYGASNNLHRNLMPTYLIQWEAMRWARSKGCTQYDLWGVPDHDEQTLEAQFSERSDGLWGVYRFKRGFGGELKRSLGAWDKVYRPLGYTAYQAIIARRAGA